MPTKKVVRKSRKKSTRWRLAGEAPSRPVATRKPKPKAETPEELLLARMQALGLAPVEQHKFHGKRRWKFDFAWLDLMLAVEVEGGIFVRGRHVRPAGFIADCEKYNEAALMGWTVIRIPVTNKGWIDEAVKLIVRAIEERSK